MPGEVNTADDILVRGHTKKEHDEWLHAVLRQALVILLLNGTQCEFGKQDVEFYGLRLTDHGVKPNPEKVRAIVDACQPNSASEVRSFLGTVGFSARYLPDLSTVSELLRRLTLKGARFAWSKEQQAAFHKLK